MKAEAAAPKFERPRRLELRYVAAGALIISDHRRWLLEQEHGVCVIATLADPRLQVPDSNCGRC